MGILTDNGKVCSPDEWLSSPERVLKFLRIPRTASEINRMRWGSPVPVRHEVEQLKKCKRRGFVFYDRKTKLWSLNGEMYSIPSNE